MSPRHFDCEEKKEKKRKEISNAKKKKKKKKKKEKKFQMRRKKKQTELLSVVVKILHCVYVSLRNWFSKLKIVLKFLGKNKSQNH